MYFLKNYKRGIKNKYRKGMPVFEMLLKDIGYSVNEFRNYVKNGFQQKTILAYPHYPSRGSTIYKVAKALGYNLTNKPGATCEVAIYWEYLTFREEFEVMEQQAKKTKVINLHSRDISKIYVDNAFKAAFGYSTAIDPTTFTGKCVKKNDINAVHDGAIIDCPIPQAEPGFIYQLLINNKHGENQVEDIRVPVVKEVVPFVYIKHRNISERFKNTTTNTRLVKTSEIFTDEEIENINRFCQKVQLEYGELDVLRNKDDGKIYIVDVNNTPQGPPANTPKADADYAINTLADCFRTTFLK